jgi:hypothetical protein
LGILVVGLPVLVWRLFNGFTAEDFGTGVLTATLLAILWTAHFTFRAVRHARQAEERQALRRTLARRSIATSVMEELDYLRPSLAVMQQRIAVRGIQFLARPQLRHALAHIDLFSSEGATELSRFDSVLRQIESHAALYEADFAAANTIAEKGWVGVIRTDLLDFDRKRVDDIRNLIAAAEKVIPLVHSQLMREC